MNKDVKDIWTGALRSGEYQQVEGKLWKCSEGYCCLGVLTDCFVEATGTLWEDATPPLGSYLSELVADWAGFTEEEREDQGNDGVDVILSPTAGGLDLSTCSLGFEHRRASAINDNYMNGNEAKGSFNDIADAIEENL